MFPDYTVFKKARWISVFLISQFIFLVNALGQQCEPYQSDIIQYEIGDKLVFNMTIGEEFSVGYSTEVIEVIDKKTHGDTTWYYFDNAFPRSMILDTVKNYTREIGFSGTEVIRVINSELAPLNHCKDSLVYFFNEVWDTAHFYTKVITDEDSLAYKKFGTSGEYFVLSDTGLVSENPHIWLSEVFAEKYGLIGFNLGDFESTLKYELAQYIRGDDTTRFAVSIGDLNFNTVQIYPNPLVDEVSINIDFPVERIDIINLNGQKIISKTYSSSRGYHSVDMTSVPNGVYFIHISGRDFSYKKRISVAR